MVKTKDLKQTAVFDASPMEVYEALMDSKKHSEFTGSRAVMSSKVGGKFTAYDGYIEGKNLELEPGKKIVQEWRGSDWPEGHYSTITYDLAASGKKTKLTFTQKGIPADNYEDIKQGWIDYYWDPLKEMFGR